MILLHAALVSDQLWLWGESPERRDDRSADWLPHGVAADRLASGVRKLMKDRSPAIEPGSLRAWIPTADGLPVPSSALIRACPETLKSTTIAPWRVDGIRLSDDATAALLARNHGKYGDVFAGPDFSFWAFAFQFAAALVVRQQILPSIEHVESGWRSAWVPVFAGDDRKRFSLLAGSMPAAGRALTPSEVDKPPATSSRAVLERFLQRMADVLVRTRKGAEQRNQRRADSVHDEWLRSLKSTNGTMTGTDAALEELLAQLAEWERPLLVADASPFRLCFQLHEPNGNPRNRWRVAYLLQDAEDPSLLVSASDVWNGTHDVAQLLRRPRFDAREYLLTALGRAKPISKRIDASLTVREPDGYDTDASGAHEFLTESAPLLEQAGFGVFLPAWWTRGRTTLRLTARATVEAPAMRASAGLSLTDVVRFRWEVAIGDEPLSHQELETLARLKEPLVSLRGQWVQLSAEEMQAATALWRREGRASLGEVVRMALGEARIDQGLAFGGVKASGWLAKMLSNLEGGSFETLPPPAGVREALRPYQVRGYSWLAFLRSLGFGAILADDMGLGKTFQALALVQRSWETEGRRPTLLICPTSVIGNWRKEVDKFTPELPVLVHHGGDRARASEFRKRAVSHALVISSFGLLPRDFEALRAVRWGAIIVDEAQNIKNAETKQARAARALQADFRIALTGTPVENSVGDLWSIMEFVNAGWLGTRADFKRRFFLPIQTARDTEAIERLRRLTAPLILRRLKTDRRIIADLPDKLEMKVFCTLTREQASLYQAIVRKAMRSIESEEGIKRKGLVLQTLAGLKQVCNHPAQLLKSGSTNAARSGKLTRLTEMLEEVLAEGDRALIFTQFEQMGDILREHLQEAFAEEVLFLHGQIPRKARDRLIERFQSDGGPRLFVLSVKAGGTGLNLTAANHVFHFDRWWNPAVEDQATDRAFRIGQTRNVEVHKFVCVGTVEERIDDMIERKKEVARSVVAVGEDALTELTNAQLKDLFALRADAVAKD